MKCKKCGSDIAEGQRFCSNCGTSVCEENLYQGGNNKKSGNKKVFLIVAIVLVLILAVIGISSNGSENTAVSDNPEKSTNSISEVETTTEI